MNIRILGAVLMLVAATGCSMCSNCTDYSSPVADGPYAGGYGRAGSAFNGVVTTPMPEFQQQSPGLAPPAPPVTP